MTARGKARKRALDLLFESDQRDVAIAEVLASRPALDPDDYAVQLAGGVGAHLVELDAVIAQHARGWSLRRMPAVDRCILRLAVYELQHEPDVPDAVVVDEAVRLASELSTDESPGFVNGVLGAIQRQPNADG
jgi:N utilization substance protein B